MVVNSELYIRCLVLFFFGGGGGVFDRCRFHCVASVKSCNFERRDHELKRLSTKAWKWM